MFTAPHSNETYLCYDDKAIPLNAVSATVYNLLFSADSAHLYWVTKQSGYRARILADGKPVYESNSAAQAGFPAETYQAMPDGSLLVLMQDDKGLERVSITPASGSSLAALFGGSQSQASMK